MANLKPEEMLNKKKSYSTYVLGADIGGTNSSIGFFGVNKDKKTVKLVFSCRYKTQELKELHHGVNDSMKRAEKQGINVKDGCFAVAGPVPPTKDRSELTNAKLEISAKKLIRKTPLKSALIINDFEAIGYGINSIPSSDIMNITPKRKPLEKAQKAILGAGTDLGKTILFYDNNLGFYVPVSSEGGHSNLPILDEDELKLAQYLARQRKAENARWGYVLSGKGIEHIYSYLRYKYETNDVIKEIDSAKQKASLISKYKTEPICNEVFEIFKKFYGRAAKCLALEAIALGGVYIAGGIAAKNSDIFDKDFLKEFDNIQDLKGIKGKIPVFLIKNYDVGMIGAAFAAAFRKDLALK